MSKSNLYQRLQLCLHLPAFDDVCTSDMLMNRFVLPLPLSVYRDVAQDRSKIHHLRVLDVDHHHLAILWVAENVRGPYISMADAKHMYLI